MSTIQVAQTPVSAAPAPAAIETWSANARRLVAATVTIVCSTVLGLAAYLTPSASGLGSHEQLGLPRCGWIIIADLPCPTCGMTTAFAHAADGHILHALHAQPMGAILAVLVAMTWLVSIHVLITGSRLGGAFTRLWNAKVAWTLSGSVVLAWLYKIAAYKGWLS
jgi:hypothetical protein